jgi:hypothetical protein
MTTSRGNVPKKSCPIKGCMCSKGSSVVLVCRQFSNWRELTFNASLLSEVDILELRPSRPLMLDDSLKLNGMRVNKQVILRNMRGFVYTSAPFLNVPLNAEGKSTVELKIANSVFAFYDKDGTSELNDERCTREKFEASPPPDNRYLLSQFSRLSLVENIVYANKLCPFVFEGSRIDILIAHSMNASNKFNFVRQTANENRQRHQQQRLNINATISYLYLFNAKLDVLDESLLEPNVFKKLRTLQVLGSLARIKHDLFDGSGGGGTGGGSFAELGALIFELYNFGEFVAGGTAWSRNLNQRSMSFRRNITLTELLEMARSEGIESSSSSSSSSSKDILIYFEDKLEQYDYPEKDFCLFNDMPVGKQRVYTVVKTRPALACTCTLMRLLRHWKDYKSKQKPDLLRTSSVSRCLSDELGFYRLLADCDLEYKSSKCCKNNNEEREETIELDLQIVKKSTPVMHMNVDVDGTSMSMGMGKASVAAASDENNENTIRARSDAALALATATTTTTTSTKTSTRSTLISYDDDDGGDHREAVAAREFFDRGASMDESDHHHNHNHYSSNVQTSEDNNMLTIRRIGVVMSTLGFVTISTILGIIIFMFK